jgi:cytochrome c-550 PedF
MSKTLSAITVAVALVAGSLMGVAPGFGHGDVTPQPVDTTGLEQLGADWRAENPYRGNARAIEIGSSGYNQNCARCHGLQVKSGGLAPDLRFLEEGKEGDEWFMGRIRNGYTFNGATRMPAFEGILSQEAMWAIRAYIETQPKD